MECMSVSNYATDEDIKSGKLKIKQRLEQEMRMLTAPFSLKDEVAGSVKAYETAIPELNEIHKETVFIIEPVTTSKP